MSTGIPRVVGTDTVGMVTYHMWELQPVQYTYIFNTAEGAGGKG